MGKDTRLNKAASAREFGVVLTAAIVLTVALTYPLAFNLGRLGRAQADDGRFSIWNVAWVARTLVVDPVHLFDANIFYPHRDTLAYSESNLGAGTIAIPVYWLTRNPYAAHNFAVLAAFILCAVGAYYLARYLTGSRPSAAVAAIGYAFCPHVFGWTAEIQLMMTFGLPYSMLAFHRLADRPSAGRGLALGAAMAMTTYFCAYYGVFVLVMVGFAVLVTAAQRGLWRSQRYVIAVAIAAVAAVALIMPLFSHYLALQETRGFSRPLSEAKMYAADWRAYVTSSARAHHWIERFAKGREVGFPGFVATIFAVAGIASWPRQDSRRRQLLVLYGALAVLALWASFGPDAFLYTVLYDIVPGFTLMRAPGRFALVVSFAIAMLAAFGVQALLARARSATVVAAVVLALVVAESIEVPPWKPTPPLDPVYPRLAALPAAPIIELPFFTREHGVFNHSKYMLASTSHWRPLVNGYSDYIPPDFFEHMGTLATFPSRDAFKILEPLGVRYAIFHRNLDNGANWVGAMARVKEFAPYLRLLWLGAEGTHDETRLYEIVAFPP